ncbi:MAG: energy-coupling factor ABC transporter permease [Gemmatimonadota bacterium]|nr:MAG: energy-coupling factor ABC transporter permease [Gemmatimonadota bacterium]
MAHIPDGFLSASVSAGSFAAAGALTAVAARQAKARLDDRAAPTLGLATAAVFAAQAVNFPVAAGTSGHLLGGTLVAVAFGPWAGFLVMTAVVIAQALIFADGGLTALGANVLNIAGVGTLLGYAIYRMLTGLAGEGPLRRALGAAAAAYLAALLTGIAAGLELGLSGIAPTRLSVGAMASVHAVIGLAEAAITGLAVWSLARKRPDLLFRAQGSTAAQPPPAVVLAGLGAVAILAGGLAIIASTAPDGLERLAINLGFADAAASWEAAPLAGYRAWIPGPVGMVVAVVLGVALLFAGTAATVRAVARARGSREG